MYALGLLCWLYSRPSEGTIKFHEYLGDGWGVLFSHPKDFTPVCTTELGYMAKLKPEFDKRNVKAIALSVDPVDSHHKWIEDINETQNTIVNFPILADADRKVSDLYDLIHPNAQGYAQIAAALQKVLKNAGLVVDRPVGTRRIYQLNPAGLDALRSQLDRP